MEKAIKESDVIAVICEDCYADCPGTCAEVEKIKALTAVQPEPQWIPVSERLPEESGYYITSNEYNGVGEDFYYDGHFWNADKNAYSVIAWMPKPEHYKPNEKQSGKEGA